MRYTHVIFDLDGTLLNTIDDLTDAGNHVCAAHGWAQHTKDEYRYFVGNGIPKLVERFSPETARDPATLAATLDGETPQYALEGSVFVGGAVVQWLRDELKITDSAAQTEEIAKSIENR